MPPETCLLCLIVLWAVAVMAWRWRRQRDSAVAERDVADDAARRWHHCWLAERQKAVTAELAAEEWFDAWIVAETARMRATGGGWRPGDAGVSQQRREQMGI